MSNSDCVFVCLFVCLVLPTQGYGRPGRRSVVGREVEAGHLGEKCRAFDPDGGLVASKGTPRRSQMSPGAICCPGTSR